MDERLRRYPIGIQNFEDLRNNGYVYVDKTELIYRLTNTNKVYFLSRPRRFGKSLLVSTLEAYFSGKKDLFNGLAMETLEKEWAVYPVLHIDFSVSKYMTAEALSAVINYQLLQWEKLYGREEGETTFSLRLKGIIQRAYTQTGKPVVILVDEYDAPMLDSNNNTELQIEIRDIMRDFFSPLKAQGQYIRFLFTDTRREKSVTELNQLFYPNLARMTSGEKGELRGTEYLICKQIIRDHDEFAGRRGCRINAEPGKEGGFTIYFTLPKK